MTMRQPSRVAAAPWAAMWWRSCVAVVKAVLGLRSPHRQRDLMPTRRRERNQQLFREVNERIHELGADFDVSGPRDLGFVCECGEAKCTETLWLTLSEYAQVPRTGAYFIVKPGHERNSHRILKRTAQYILVEDPANVG